MLNFFTFVIYFFIYSFLGWCCEVIYCSWPKKNFVNRGFLHAPLCPIYGMGAVLSLLLYPLKEVNGGFILIAILGAIITSGVEYFTSYFMELIFDMRWWDYSKNKWNINGRICLRNSLLFMLLTILIIYVIHPNIILVVGKISNKMIYILGVLITFELVVDTIVTSIKANNFKNVIKKAEMVKIKVISYFLNKFPNMKIMKEKMLINIKEIINKISK